MIWRSSLPALVLLALPFSGLASQDIPAEPATDDPAAATTGSEDEGVTRIRWQPWGRGTFEVAARLKRPVLLYLRRADCRLCELMERDIFDDPELVTDLADNVVPIAVDADRRPDIATRYVIGAVPTVAYLLPNAEPMYRIEDPRSLERVGAYMTDPERFSRYMSLAVRYLKRHARELRDKAREVAALEAAVRDYAPGVPPFQRIDDLKGQIRDRADFTHGGFGRGWKTIDDAPFRLFRVLAQDDPASPLAVLTLKTARAMLGGAIHDQVEGGFHHYSTERDWSVPSREKRLDANARALRLLVAAARLAPEDPTLRRGVETTLAFIRERLSLADGGLALAQRGGLGPDDPGTYFEVDAETRKTLKPPPIESTINCAYGAGAVVALLEAAALLESTPVEDAAFRALDFLTDRLYRKGRGMSRTLDDGGQPSIQGLLVDQVRAMEAYLAAFQRRGRPEDLARALEIAAFCRDNLRRKQGYHVDRPADAAAVGKMKRPIVDFSENGRLALALIRLSTLSGDPSWRVSAAAAVGALTAGVEKVTERDAPYVEALLALRAPAIRVLIPGEATDPTVVALRRRAASVARPGVTVIPGPGGGTVPEMQTGDMGAWICAGERCIGPVRTPDGLEEGVNALAEGRD